MLRRISGVNGSGRGDALLFDTDQDVAKAAMNRQHSRTLRAQPCPSVYCASLNKSQAKRWEEEGAFARAAQRFIAASPRPMNHPILSMLAEAMHPMRIDLIGVAGSGMGKSPSLSSREDSGYSLASMGPDLAVRH